MVWDMIGELSEYKPPECVTVEEGGCWWNVNYLKLECTHGVVRLTSQNRNRGVCLTTEDDANRQAVETAKELGLQFFARGRAFGAVVKIENGYQAVKIKGNGRFELGESGTNLDEVSVAAIRAICPTGIPDEEDPKEYFIPPSGIYAVYGQAHVTVES